MRLNKFIASSGICSRRKADELILNSKIKINGNVVTELGMDVKESDIVEYDGQVLKLQEEKVYLMLNKPTGYITTSIEQFGRKCVLDLIHENVRVFPIGRLDMDTHGMLLLTNDGEFANKLMHPKNEIKKTYIVTVNEEVSDDKLKRLSEGVDIGDYITKPAEAQMIDKNHLKIIISEGKNRQVRKMCKAVNINLIALKRESIGKLTLGSLKLGKYKRLTSEDINKIFK